MSCSEKQSMFCINLNYPPYPHRIHPTDTSRLQIPKAGSFFAFNSNQEGKKNKNIFVLCSWFYGFYGGFHTLDLLNHSQCQSTERCRPWGEAPVQLSAAVRVSLLNAESDSVAPKHNTSQNGIKFKCTQEWLLQFASQPPPLHLWLVGVELTQKFAEDASDLADV